MCQKDTFYTYLSNIEMKPMSLPYLIGHMYITLTLKYYENALVDSTQAEMIRLVT